MKAERNAPCPCGSGKKYKRCHGAPRADATAHVAAAIRVATDHQKAGRFSQAQALFRNVLRADPGNAHAMHNLGWLAHLAGDDNQAQALLRRGLALAPSDWAMHYSLGRILKELGISSEAEASLRRASALNPGFAPIHTDLGNVLIYAGRTGEAVACIERALAMDPQNHSVFSNWLHALNYLPGQEGAAMFDRHLAYARRFERAAPVGRPPLPPSAPGERIKLGYVSGDFRQLAVAWFIEPVLAHHDRNAFEVFCYSANATVDDVTRRLQSHAGHWRAIAAMPDQEAARLVRGDGIDILVDLSGHTVDNRLTMFALKPAPVQVSWLGYFNTTGLRSIDYLISDPVSSPPDDAQRFSETLLRLPRVRLCYRPPAYAPAVAPLPALAAGRVTFGSFNKLGKLNDAVIALWSDILRSTPGSRLLLKSAALRDEAVRRRYGDLFAARGIDPERLLLRPHSPHAQMLGEYGDVDIALDPFPFGGGLTTCEALWQGVPVLTLPGDALVSRQSASFLAAIGLADWIAGSPDEYAAKAAGFAADSGALAQLRAALRARMALSPVCDAAVFTRDLEALYRGMRDG